MPVCACPSVRARCAHASVCVLRVCMLVCACPVRACLSVQPGVCVPVFVCSVCAFWCVRTRCVRACVPVSAAWCVRTPCVHASVCVPIYAAWCVRTRLRVPWCVPVCACHEAGAGSQRAAASSPGFEMCALFSGLRKGGFEDRDRVCLVRDGVHADRRVRAIPRSSATVLCCLFTSVHLF